MQPPRFGHQAAPRKPWQLAAGQPDLRKRGRAGCRERERVRREEPLCRTCLDAGRTTPTDVIDHIIPLSLGGKDERSNKQGLCDPCHDEKSKAERAAGATERASW